MSVGKMIKVQELGLVVQLKWLSQRIVRLTPHTFLRRTRNFGSPLEKTTDEQLLILA
jgi:hypothetical protein